VVGAVVFVASFGLYAAFAAPALGWLDSSEFVAAAATLGVPHSPGHPLQALLGYLATLVPIGDVAIRVNLLSAACMAAGNTLLFTSLRELSDWLHGGGRRWSAVMAAALTCSFAISSAVWAQAGRAEVYALETALLAGLLLAMIRYLRTGSARPLIALGLIAGLALATHHFITLTLLVPATIAVLWVRRPPASTLALALATGALGLSVFVYLPLRAASDPLINWGNPDTIGRLVWTISGRAFTGSLVAQHASPMTTDLAQVTAAIVTAAPALVVVALFGIYLGLRLAIGRALVLTCAGALVLTIVGRAVLGFDPETPDHYAYLIPALLALAALAAVGIAGLESTLPNHSKPITLSAAAVVMALSLPFIDDAKVDQRSAYAADEIARLTVDEPPPRALAVTSYFQTAFRTLALHSVEAARPDLIIVDRSFLAYPGEREAVTSRHPELRQLLEAGLEPGVPAPIEALREVARTRPVVIELHFNLGSDYHQLLGDAGAFASLGAAPVAAARYRRLLDEVLSRATGADRQWAQLHILWTDYVHLIHACERGTMAEAARIYSHSRSYAAGDTMLEELASRCGLERQQ
jgi:hypothetical protein